MTPSDSIIFWKLIVISLVNYFFLNVKVIVIFHSYGLGSAVMSKDLERCERLSKAFQAGIVWINSSQPTLLQAPWGGTKRGGFGRELGYWGLENFECEASDSVHI